MSIKFRQSAWKRKMHITPLNVARTICSLVLAFSMSFSANAQPFPVVWPRTDYEFNQSVKGRYTLINYGPGVNVNQDKAFIFATGIPSQEGAKEGDLLRLTCHGRTTFNSPYPSFDVNLNFCTQANLQGGISGASNILRIYGKDRLELGYQGEYSMVSIKAGGVDFGRNIYVDHNTIRMMFGLSHDTKYGWIGSLTNDDVVVGTGSRAVIHIDGKTQNVYIGLPLNEVPKVRAELKGKYTLFVRNGILAENYSIAPIASWVDYVFSPSYNLPCLKDVESFITQNRHLPDIPSEKEVSEEGYSQHEMNKALLKKIEELTLYAIQQQKEIEDLRKKLEELRK